jgi:hypothetical protein
LRLNEVDLNEVDLNEVVLPAYDEVLEREYESFGYMLPAQKEYQIFTC